ncbi:MAG TPA: helix-turn-helix domain-containing protein [Pseudonocardia sp.]|jgi:DNA-binding HxlR family transcriptional regulator|nr:helix-turn-helix domain-containing protein [Pseudonocardia sp.]
MSSTPRKVSSDPPVPEGAHRCSIEDVEQALRVLEGRWKLVILFHLFDAGARRFSELERLIPEVTQKMLIQQLKALEADGVVRRTAHPVVPPHVEYQLTDLGEQLKPALEALRDWSDLRAARLVGPQA